MPSLRISECITKRESTELGNHKHLANRNLSIRFADWSVLAFFIMLGYHVANACPIMWCSEAHCTLSGGSSVCSECIVGYYQSLSQNDCLKCLDNCRNCKTASECQHCNIGWYLDTSTKRCNSCQANCDQCIDSRICSLCSNNYILSDDKTSCVPSKSNQVKAQDLSKASNLGAVIASCVSALVCALCCVITILHQRNKQKKAAAVEPKHGTIINPSRSENPQKSPNPCAETYELAASSYLAAPASVSPVSRFKFKKVVQSENLSAGRGSFLSNPNPPNQLAVGSPYKVGSVGSTQGISSRPAGLGLPNSHDRLPRSPWSSFRAQSKSSPKATPYMTPKTLNSRGSLVNKLSLRQIPTIKLSPKQESSDPRVVLSGPISSRSISSSRNILSLHQGPYSVGVHDSSKTSAPTTTRLSKFKRIE